MNQLPHQLHVSGDSKSPDCTHEREQESGRPEPCRWKPRPRPASPRTATWQGHRLHPAQPTPVAGLNTATSAAWLCMPFERRMIVSSAPPSTQPTPITASVLAFHTGWLHACAVVSVHAAGCSTLAKTDTGPGDPALLVAPATAGRPARRRARPTPAAAIPGLRPPSPLQQEHAPSHHHRLPPAPAPQWATPATSPTMPPQSRPTPHLRNPDHGTACRAVPVGRRVR
jgi:hypothetical protein